MAVNYAIYQIVLYDSLGTRLAIIDDYRSLQYKKQINAGGFFSMFLDYNSSKRELFELDAIIEVKRRIPGVKDWYTDFVGHCEDFNRDLFENANDQYNVVGTSQTGLLGRRIIAYDETTSEAAKSAAAETVMKEYVKENIGSDATVANNRFADGRILSGGVNLFSVQADGANGDTWNGDRSGKVLLKVLNEIAKFSEIDFQVETDTAIGNYIFKTYVDQLGEDRTTTGLDPTTGLNTAGNAPHIFAPERGNVSRSSLKDKHRKEFNRVYAFGKGAGPTRNIRYREDTDAQDLSPLNLREAMRGASSQDSNTQLDDVADEWLEKLQAVERFDFTPLDIPSSLYGVHYDFGDKITVKIGDTENNKRIVSTTITISGGQGESNKTLQFEDI